ncbi:hypothetical protein E2562_024871 [Oryza meyeriana var. granulata]|uniref:Methyltransferase n=1 Tax=Oryza meyeriana var. granulata TaxID=110450 RepID=A0A6G1DNK4_9ORYZ|nr:hypothetical protein E2562_024871 [Oryza meyeriana var. granulata]
MASAASRPAFQKARVLQESSNVNQSRLAEIKGGQNWVHEKGKLWWFPGGGTHFKHGASEYIEKLGNMTANSTGDLRSAGVVQVYFQRMGTQLVYPNFSHRHRSPPLLNPREPLPSLAPPAAPVLSVTGKEDGRGGSRSSAR